MATNKIINSDERKPTGTSDGPTKSYTITGSTLGATGNAYTDGELIGNLLILSSVVRETKGYTTLMSLVMQDLNNLNRKIELVIFDSDPTATTFTDNAALDINDADLPKVVGQHVINAGDYQSYSDNSVGTSANIGLPLKSNAVKDLWVCFVARGTGTQVADELSSTISFYG